MYVGHITRNATKMWILIQSTTASEYMQYLGVVLLVHPPILLQAAARRNGGRTYAVLCELVMGLSCCRFLNVS